MLFLLVLFWTVVFNFHRHSSVPFYPGCRDESRFWSFFPLPDPGHIVVDFPGSLLVSHIATFLIPSLIRLQLCLVARFLHTPRCFEIRWSLFFGMRFVFVPQIMNSLQNRLFRYAFFFLAKFCAK